MGESFPILIAQLYWINLGFCTRQVTKFQVLRVFLRAPQLTIAYLSPVISGSAA